MARCARCGHDWDIHAVDGHGVTPEPYCEEDECECPGYVMPEDEGTCEVCGRETAWRKVGPNRWRCRDHDRGDEGE
jgi:hypothetical protein